MRQILLFTLFFAMICLEMSAQIIQKPVGCFAGTNGTNPAVLAHPDARGVLLIEHWGDIETSPGVFNFSVLDSKISTVTNAGLKYTLAIAGGAFGSPDWLIDSLGASYFSFSYSGQSWRLPLWWDSLVSQRLSLLITELGNKYGSDTNLSHVYVTQMSVNGVEGHLNGVNMVSFASNGYTDQKWIDEAESAANQFAAAFPDKPIVFEIHEIDQDTVVPSTIINDLYNAPALCKRIGLGMWWISGKTTYQSDLLTFIEHFEGDKYAQVIGRSDQLQKFKDSSYASVFDQARILGIRYIEPWPYEFQNHTHDTLLHDFNVWADSIFSPSDTCPAPVLALEPVSKQEIAIFPNPSSGKIMLTIAGLDSGEAELSVFSISGQLLLYRSLTDPSTPLNIENFPSGLYFFQIRMLNGYQITQKVIIK